MVIEQILFGYRDGHRQLAGSTKLDRLSSSTLLGVTDASVGSSEDRLVTALPLHGAEMYALSMTWAAPEVERPGAVWAHTLLISLDDLRSMREPQALLRLIRRPDLHSIGEYDRSLTLPSDEHFLSEDSFDLRVLAAVARADVEGDGSSAVLVEDLKQAEAALLALWSVGWPALRISFSFRTRETLRVASDDGFVSVARRIRGRSLSSPLPLEVPEWAGVLAAASAHLDSKPEEFLQEFGPHESASLTALRSLAEVFVAATSNDVESVVTLLAEQYAQPSRGRHLKRALFGPQSSMWWQITEEDRVDAIVATRKSIWDTGALDLERRLQRQINQGRTLRLVALRPASGPRPIRSALLDALVVEVDTVILSQVAGIDPSLATDVAARRPDIAENPAFWAALSTDEARKAIVQLSPSRGILTAAAAGGQTEALLEVVPAAELLPSLLEAGETRQLARVASELPESSLASVVRENDRLRLSLWNEGVAVGPLNEILQSLEALRSKPDAGWFAAAVRALGTSSNKERGLVLQTVFGPLHRGITDDRLDRRLWKELDPLLPPASDPSMRLRKLLVAEVRKGAWSAKAVDLALRDSGPHIRELRSDLKEGDPASNLIAAGLKELKKWSPF